MIIAVDLLPKIKCLYHVNKLIPYGQMDIEEMDISISSHVIHGCKTIQLLQGDLVFTGILSGFLGRYAKHHLDTEKIKSDIIWSENETPYEMEMIDLKSNKETVLNKKINQINKNTVGKLEQRTKERMKSAKTLLLEGKLLGDMNPSIYNELIQAGKNYNVKTVMTTDDARVLGSVMEQVPYGLMFSTDQLKKLGIDTSQVENIVQELRQYLDQGVRYIGVDLENQGGLLLSKSKFCYVEPDLDEKGKWLTESSAAFLGAMTIGIKRKYEQEKIAKLAVAASFAFQIKDHYQKNAIDQLLNKVKVRELSKKPVRERE